MRLSGSYYFTTDMNNAAAAVARQSLTVLVCAAAWQHLALVGSRGAQRHAQVLVAMTRS